MVNLLFEPAIASSSFVRRDMERLQGTWHFFAGTREAQLLITGNHFTIRFKNGETYGGTFTIDPARKPRAIDLQITEGPDRHKGKVALAIYAIDGDRLIWSPARPGDSERPTFFPHNEDTDHLCIVFQREQLRQTGS